MKIKLLAILGIFFMTVACDKESLDSKSNFFRVKIDGKLYEATGVNAFATKGTDANLIYGIFDDKRSMYISLDPKKAVGTHQLIERPNFTFYRDEADLGFRSDYNGASGEVIITEITSTEVKGTFKAVIKEGPKTDAKKYTATEGEFSVPFR